MVLVELSKSGIGSEIQKTDIFKVFMLTKICSICKVEKDLNEFHKRADRASGVMSACKICRQSQSVDYYEKNTTAIISRVSKYQKDNANKARIDHRLWRSLNRVKTKGYALKLKYNLSLADYNTLLERQCGVCAICGQEAPPGSYLSVDHDHVTGTVRGLLCNSCNLGLGWFHDNEETLITAVEYLRKNKQCI